LNQNNIVIRTITGQEVSFLPEGELPASANLEANLDQPTSGADDEGMSGMSDEQKIKTLEEMGATKEMAEAALKSTNGNLQKAIEMFL